MFPPAGTLWAFGALVALLTITPGPDTALVLRSADEGGFLAGLRQGLLTNLLNPKVGAFYMAVLPQFIPADAPQLAWGVALASVHALLGIVWLGALTLAARRASVWLRKQAVVRWFDGVAGSVIAALGVRLALVR